MKVNTHYVSMEQMMRADMNWRLFFKNAPDARYHLPKQRWTYIRQYLGCDLFQENYHIPNEAYQRLEALLSPYHETILAAYCLKKGIRWK